MERAYIFAGVGSCSDFSVLTIGLDFLKPCEGSVAARELTGFLFYGDQLANVAIGEGGSAACWVRIPTSPLEYSRAKKLAFPDKGEILLNRREGLLRFATRYEPKHKPYGQPQTMQGKVDQSPLRGVGGLICFSRPSASVS